VRLGVLAPPWLIPAHGYGGAEAVIDGLCRGLKSAGHEVALWAATDSTCPVTRSGVVSSDNLSNAWTLPIEIHHILAGYDWMGAMGVQIVHDHTLLGPLIGPSRLRVPIVTTNHLPFTTASLSALYRSVCERVTVVAVSESQAEGAADIRIARVIHHGIDVEAIPYGHGEGDERGPYLAFLGRMASEKGVHAAAQAARAAEARLLIAARMEEPQEFHYYRRVVRPLLGGRVQYIGELGWAQKIAFLGRASALINPISWPEPFGLTMIEALACGTPVIALRRGSVGEIIEQGVTGAICNDLPELIGRLQHLDKYDRRRCREVAAKRFSIERMVAEHVELYLSLLDPSRDNG
jgi:glycosyltransferase involved in cell wall biosynthesis